VDVSVCRFLDLFFKVLWRRKEGERERCHLPNFPFLSSGLLARISLDRVKREEAIMPGGRPRTKTHKHMKPKPPKKEKRRRKDENATNRRCRASRFIHLIFDQLKC